MRQSKMLPTRPFVLLLGLAMGSGCATETAPTLDPDGAAPDVTPIDRSGEQTHTTESDAAWPDMGSALDAEIPDGAPAPDVAAADVGWPSDADPPVDSGVDAEKSCDLDQCEIEGECYDNEAPDPAGPCRICLVMVDRIAWSNDDAARCDDGNACTDEDTCVDGLCQGATRPCDDGNVCTDDFCDPETGDCATAHNESPCDDGNRCLIGDRCVAGACQSGEVVPSCDDGNPCTVGRCEPESGCVQTPEEGAPCNDGDACTQVDQCAQGVCVGTEPVDCDDQNVCTVDMCDADGACQHASVAHVCADENPCTDETCDPELGCVYPFNTEGCNDGNACTADDTCHEGACLGQPIDPDDQNLCTDDRCDPALGIQRLYNALPCNDGSVCTLGDACSEGACTPGETTLVCGDDNVCTDNRCDPIEGCVQENNQDPCDDGTVCTIDDRCGDGACRGDRVSCDDGNPCTTDTCHDVDGCQHTVIVSNGCRPNITVTQPRRAETILGGAVAEVVVAGEVTSGAGAITTLTINEEAVAVDPATGAFSHLFSARVGGNTLVIEAWDELGSARKRVQSFHWSKTYTKPDANVSGSGMVNPGLGLWMAQQTLDDGDHSRPPNDLATIFEIVMTSFDIAGLVPSPAAAGVDASALGDYDIYIEDLRYGTPRVALTAIDGGMHMTATIRGVTADIQASKTCSWSWRRPLSCTGPGTITGDMDIDSIVISADVVMTVDRDHVVQVAMENSDVSFSEPDVSIDGLFGFLAEWIIGFFMDDFVADIESEFNTEIRGTLGPLLADAFQALAFNLDFELERLDGAIDPRTGAPRTITVQLESDYAYVEFGAGLGGVLGLRARATTPERGVPAGETYDQNRGTPGRVGCGRLAQRMVVPKLAPFELIFPDDTLNQILRAAWWGGLLEFPVGPDLLGGVDLSQYNIADLDMQVSALLPPLASDCGPDGELTMHVGDLMIVATLELFDQALDVVMFASFEAGIVLQAGEGEVAIQVEDIENLQMEVNVLQEALVGSESVMEDLITSQLMPSLEEMLGGGEALAAFPLPEIDLSPSLGMPAGEIMIAIESMQHRDWSTRRDGNTVVYGRLR